KESMTDCSCSAFLHLLLLHSQCQFLKGRVLHGKMMPENPSPKPLMILAEQRSAIIQSDAG
ncbi:hypothetical protein ED035_24515, partial [Escherichia coli]|nr:hypothetical protein [Escherichia coli]